MFGIAIVVVLVIVALLPEFEWCLKKIRAKLQRKQKSAATNGKEGE